MPKPVRFKNRLQAGELLARRLASYAGRPEVLVLALPRGGVPVGFSIAKKLKAPLDVLIVRKIGLPGHEELAVGAVASGGKCVLQWDILNRVGLPPEVVDVLAQRELCEIERREQLYRTSGPMAHLRERIVILADDGLASGATMRVAIQVVRDALPARIVIAAPVAARETYEQLSAEADEFVCLRTPEPFYAVGFWYDDFEQTTDEEVIRLLEANRQQQTQHAILPPAGDTGSTQRGERRHDKF